jgi:hypothetical protein
MRDLAQMLVHVHDAEIEIGEDPEPPAQDGPLFCPGALGAPTLAGLWLFRPRAQLSSGPQHLLLIGLPIAGLKEAAN